MDWRHVSSAQFKLWSVALFAIGTLTAGVGWQVVYDRTTVIAAANRSTQQFSLALEESAAGTFQAAALIAEHIATITLDNLDSLGNPTSEAIARWRDVLKDNDFLHGIGVIQVNGVVPISVIRRQDGTLWINDDPKDLSEWSDFDAQAEEARVSSPRRSDYSDHWLITLTLPMRNKQGTIVGVVYVNIALDTFSGLFSEVLPTGGNSVALFRTNGQLLFGDPLVEDTIGMSLAHLDLFTKHFAAAPFGTYYANAPRAGDRRVMTYRKLSGWPLLLTVDLSFDEALVSWRQRALFYILAGIVASTVILSLTVWLSVQFRRDDLTRIVKGAQSRRGSAFGGGWAL